MSNTSMWHYEKDGQQMGPVSEQEIADLSRAGTVNRQTLVWREGMPDWVPAAWTPLDSIVTAASPPGASTIAASNPSTSRPQAMRWAINGVAAIGGYLAVSYLPAKVCARIFGGSIAGLLCGLIPFFVGRTKSPKFAKSSLLWCSVAGAAFGLLLALPVAIAFTVVLIVKQPEAPEST